MFSISVLITDGSYMPTSSPHHPLSDILAFYKEMEKLAKPKAEDVTTAEVEVLSDTYALSTGEFTMVVGPNRNKNK